MAFALVRLMRFTLALCHLVTLASSACPRCTDTNPVMSGSYSTLHPHTFQPTQNCYLGVPEVPEIFSLLAGSWLYSAGGSNGWASTYSALASPTNSPSFTPQPHPSAMPPCNRSQVVHLQPPRAAARARLPRLGRGALFQG